MKRLILERMSESWDEEDGEEEEEDVSAIEAEHGRLRYTTLDNVNASTPLVEFWSSISKF